MKNNIELKMIKNKKIYTYLLNIIVNETFNTMEVLILKYEY